MVYSDTVKIVIAQPAAYIYPWIAEPEKIIQWMKNIDKIFYNEDNHPETVNRLCSNKDRFNNTMTILLSENNKLIEGRIVSKFKFTYIYISLYGMFKQTQLTYSRTIKWRSFIPDFFFHLKYWNHRKQQEDELKELRKLIEAKTTNTVYLEKNLNNVILEKEGIGRSIIIYHNATDTTKKIKGKISAHSLYSDSRNSK